MSESVHVRGNKGLIFIAEDEAIVSGMLKRLLEGEGHRVRKFDEPHEILRQEMERPDLLITDYFMLGMNGLDLTSRCRERWPGLRVIMISGHHIQGELSRAQEKPELFLSKPFQPEAIIQAVDDLMGNA